MNYAKFLQYTPVGSNQDSYKPYMVTRDLHKFGVVVTLYMHKSMLVYTSKNGQYVELNPLLRVEEQCYVIPL